MSDNSRCECFACDIPSLDTIKIEKINGVLSQSSLLALDSLKAEIDIINKQDTQSSLITIKDGVKIIKPIQIINLLDKQQEDKQQTDTTTEIILGENSFLTMIYCDDTLPKSSMNVNHTIHVRMKPYSTMALYKMENVNNSTSITSNITFDMDNNADLSTFFITLNGGKLANKIRVNFNADNSKADLNGLYLMDGQQSVDTIVDVFHYKNACQSNQLFKGILDDMATANFLGHILVDYDAKDNQAHQKNNNILLTDKAKVSTRPVLEIYNDDVQCSHGATTGQLDEQALYYLRTRGISHKSAQMLLMNAFCQSVLSKSHIEALKEGLSQLVQKRLEGGLNHQMPFKISI